MNYNRIQFEDLFEVLIARKILVKADNNNRNDLQKVNLSIVDFFQSQTSINRLEEELKNVSITRFDTITESVTHSLSQIFHIPLEPRKETIRLIEYYNLVLEQKLNFLIKGDNAGLKSCIESITIGKKFKLYTFEIEFTLNSILTSIKSWFNEYFNIQTKIENYLKAGIKGTAPTFRKQSEFFIQKVIELQNMTGATKVNISLNEWNLRLAVLFNEDVQILHAFNLNYKDKALIPIYLEINGIVDIIDFSVISSTLNPEQIEIQYSVSKPCIQNIFEADTEFININTRKDLTETQLVILDKTFDELRSSLIFERRTNLSQAIPDLLIWLVKRILYCLEEESYLRNKANEWYNYHKNDRYIKMEDDFFLPFIYEKLVDSFGNNAILKKPKKYKGEIDLLYKNMIPIELKVWIDKNKSLDNFIDEKFPNSGQAASYASENRLGILLVLDLSSRNEGITNLENCWKILTKNFDINYELPTKIIVSIFHCSYLSPSLNK